MRLNRYLASAGLGSRRGCEELIREGRVTVNGKICTDLSTTVGDGDFVKVGNSVRYTRKDLDMFVQRGAKDTTGQDHQLHPSV